MNAYVDANKKKTGSNPEDSGESSADMIIQSIERDEDGNVEEQTTYDDLIKGYAYDSAAANSKQIDAEYCRSIIECFEKRPDPNIDYAEYEDSVKSLIAEVLEKLATLDQKANMNISDYNSYIPALHIKKLSGICYYEDMSSSVYQLIAVISGFVLSCLVAIAYEVIKKYSMYSAKEAAADNEAQQS